MKWRVTILYQLQSLASPVIGCALIGFAVGCEAVLCVLPGQVVLTGIMMAEYNRRTTWLSIFFARLYTNYSQEDTDIKKYNDATSNH